MIPCLIVFGIVRPVKAIVVSDGDNFDSYTTATALDSISNKWQDWIPVSSYNCGKATSSLYQSAPNSYRPEGKYYGCSSLVSTTTDLYFEFSMSNPAQYAASGRFFVDVGNRSAIGEQDKFTRIELRNYNAQDGGDPTGWNMYAMLNNTSTGWNLLYMSIATNSVIDVVVRVNTDTVHPSSGTSSPGYVETNICVSGGCYEAVSPLFSNYGTGNITRVTFWQDIAGLQFPIDDIDFSYTPPTLPDYPTEGQLTWNFPYDGVVINNSEWNDWNVLANYATGTTRDYMMLRIVYQDSSGGVYQDWDWVASSTGDTLYAIDRTLPIPDGQVTSWGEMLGTDLENCTDILDEACVWYGMGTLETITWTSSSTGQTIWDVQSPTSPYSTTSEEFSAIQDELDENLKSSLLSTLFPFNMIAHVIEQWGSSSNGTMPSDLAFLDVTDASGTMSITLPKKWFEATSTMSVFGGSIFTTDSTLNTWFGRMRTLSTYVLYFLFILGVYWRGTRLYEELTK